VLLANGDGTFTATTHNVAESITSIAAGDFNGDGKPDLAMVSKYGGVDGAGGMTLLLGNGDGSFQTPIYYSTGSSPTFVSVADFNSEWKVRFSHS